LLFRIAFFFSSETSFFPFRMSESIVLRGVMAGHEGWVTSIATTAEQPDMILTGSRDKKLIMWNSDA
jgi:hypothetical protein